MKSLAVKKRENQDKFVAEIGLLSRQLLSKRDDEISSERERDARNQIEKLLKVTESDGSAELQEWLDETAKKTKGPTIKSVMKANGCEESKSVSKAQLLTQLREHIISGE